MATSAPHELKVTLETDHDIGGKQTAEALLAALEADPQFAPERFGDHEPLRTRYGEARERVHEIWHGKEIREGYATGVLLLSRAKRIQYLASVRWTRGQRRMNTVTMAIASKRSVDEHADAALTLADRLCRAVQAQYGYLCDRREYVCRNMTGWWAHPKTGRWQGGAHHGADRTKHLPGVYWMNIFGPKYVTFFGRAKLLALGERAREQPGGYWLVQAGDKPSDWEDELAQRERRYIKEALGPRAFFDLDAPDRGTVAPQLDLIGTTGGLAGGVVVEPIGRTFFPSEAAARAFLPSVLERVARVRARGTPGVFDLSPQSLKVLDGRVTGWLAAVSYEGRRDLILDVSAYVGEVLRRSLGGWWDVDPEALMPVVRLDAPAQVELPLIRAIKRADDAESLFTWFEVVAAMRKASRS